MLRRYCNPGTVLTVNRKKDRRQWWIVKYDLWTFRAPRGTLLYAYIGINGNRTFLATRQTQPELILIMLATNIRPLQSIPWCQSLLWLSYLSFLGWKAAGGIAEWNGKLVRGFPYFICTFSLMKFVEQPIVHAWMPRMQYRRNVPSPINWIENPSGSRPPKMKPLYRLCTLPR